MRYPKTDELVHHCCRIHWTVAKSLPPRLVPKKCHVGNRRRLRSNVLYRYARIVGVIYRGGPHYHTRVGGHSEPRAGRDFSVAIPEETTKTTTGSYPCRQLCRIHLGPLYLVPFPFARSRPQGFLARSASYHHFKDCKTAPTPLQMVWPVNASSTPAPVVMKTGPMLQRRSMGLPSLPNFTSYSKALCIMALASRPHYTAVIAFLADVVI